MSFVFSTPDQMERIKRVLAQYTRLPLSDANIPGAFLEAVLANVRSGVRLNTYDFIDVHQPREHVGWQIKSTRSTTPVTWKRAKIPTQEALIQASRQSPEGVQALGNAIIGFCNAHAKESIDTYGLDEIGYARLILFPDGAVRYFERLLCTRDDPIVFRPEEFRWRWSIQKEGKKKEQLSALHGIHQPTGEKWWAWHGLGENQLHFSGERAWWPAANAPQAISFRFPSESEKVSIERLLELLEAL